MYIRRPRRLPAELLARADVIVTRLSATPGPAHRRPRRVVWPILAGVAALVVIAVIVVVIAGGGTSVTSSKPAALPPIYPSRAGPEAMFTSGSVATDTPAALDTLKALGINRVHVYMHWADIAPDPASKTEPAFDATDPGAYPPGGWAPYDALDRNLAARHLGSDLDLVPPPPRWAEGKGAPDPKTQPEWNPSAAEFGQFVHAVGVRYSGHYTPPGASTPLPRVAFWSIWNEPNIGIQLAPEAIDNHQVEVSPRYYRAIVDAAWQAFGATGHGHDTILIGEMAPAGGTQPGAEPGNFNSMPPLRYLRALYCVDAAYQPLRGSAATLRGCPATAAGSASFAAANPGLFHASGFADHPYPQGLPPNEATPNEPDFAELAAIGKLQQVLDRMQRLYGSSTQFPIWSTEFGYQTAPPDPEAGTVTPAKAAYYLNWAEYLTWLDPRLRSFDQYLLNDPPNGYFAFGLLTAAGAPKPGYYAFQLPLFLPVTATAARHPLDVWGCVRPAPGAQRRTHTTQFAQIQYSSGQGGAFRTVSRVPITGPHGYFEVRHTFPGSGEVRLAWTPRHGPTQFSRTVDITLR